MKGLIHIYSGDGKGKTTAAIGLIVRAVGSGKKVALAQFLKSGNSSEISVLKSIENVSVFNLANHRGFYKKQNETERKETKKECRELFEKVTNYIKNDIDLLVLDEIVSVLKYGIIDEECLIDFIKNKPNKLEIVITGRNPSKKLLDLADYITDMKKNKHPYDDGIKARQGIEFWFVLRRVVCNQNLNKLL